MVTISASANHLEVEVDPVSDAEFLRLAQLLGVNADGVCKVSVIFIREDLTDEHFYENFKERGKRELADRNAQLDWTKG